MPARTRRSRHAVTPSSRSGARLASTLLMVVALTACSGETSDPGPGRPDSSTAPAQQVEGWQLDARVTRIAGRLPEGQRAEVAKRVGKVVQRHLDAAYLRDYPMRRAPGAFADFTAGVKKQAKRDRKVLTGRGFGRVDAVSVDRAATYVAVLAPRRQVLGATARLDIDLRVETGEDSRTVRVRGRLLLTPTADGWRIFGYDVSRSSLGKPGTERTRATEEGRQG